VSARSEELTDRDDEPEVSLDASAAAESAQRDGEERTAPPVDVPQDVAEETARAVSEAAGDADVEAAATSEAMPSHVQKPDRHTPLYGRGVRVLPWKHRSSLKPAQRRRRKIIKRTAWGCVAVMVGTVGWSVTGALTAPGTDTVQVRLAEWGRDHGLGGVVTTLERWQYELNPPKKGGLADQSLLNGLGPTAEPPAPGKGKPTTGKPGTPGQSVPADGVRMRPALVPPATPPLNGEGVFHVAVTTPDGQPIIQLAKVRPDNTYTSVFEDVLWIDQKHTSYVLHPGTEGGINSKVPVSDQVTVDQRANLVALFNGGFKIEESKGGYYDHGITVAPLVNGAASEVITTDGHLSIGMWGRDFTMGPNIASVRQNLKLMVDNSQVVPYIDQSASIWGRTDKGSAAVWRSGVGVTAQGDIVWVGGNYLTADALADLLVRAGAVRGMQLDINLRWATFQYFPNRDGNPATSKLYDDFLRPANRFFDHSTKDFMAIYLR
jgi:hypothetical protein